MDQDSASCSARPRATALQVFVLTVVGAIERSRETMRDDEYAAALEIIERWLGAECARAGKASRRLRVVGSS